MRMKQPMKIVSKSPVGVVNSESIDDEVIPISPHKSLNIKEEEESDNEESKKIINSKNEVSDSITKALRKLQIGDNNYNKDKGEDDDDDDDEINPNMVAKCPTRTKDKLKENAKANASPYPQFQQSFLFHSHTGGEVIIDGNRSYIPNIVAPDDYIPQPVLDHCAETNFQDFSDKELEDFLKGLTTEDLAKVDEIFNTLKPSEKIKSGNNQTKTNDQPEYCNSPHDSSYGTLSPTSVPSPYSLHSPNPNIPQPKYDNNLLCELDSGIALSPYSSTTSPSMYQQDYDYLNTNEITYQYNQDKSKWIVPTSYQITNNTSSSSQMINPTESGPLTTIPKNSTTNTINDLPNIPIFNGQPAPIQSYVLDRSLSQSSTIIKPQQKQQQSIISPPSGEPISNITIVQQPSQEVKKYTQLLPVNKKNLYNIRPGGVTVTEIDLDISGAERLNKMCNIKIKEIVWTIVCLEKEDEINALNELKQTKLMQTLLEKPSKQFLEMIFVRVRRIIKDKRKELLEQRDIKGQNALYMAALLHPERPVLSRFLADAYVELNMNPDEVYGDMENNLFHILAKAGDTYERVLADLLHVNLPNGRKAFNINRKNKKSLTALHVAAKYHLVKGTTLAITQLLIRNGAQITLQNEKSETPLHIAINGSFDSTYIKAILQSPYASTCVNIQDVDGNTPLHLAIAKNHIAFDKQKEIIAQLITSGASHNIHNRNGKFALSLASPERKQELKNLLNKKQPISLNF